MLDTQPLRFVEGVPYPRANRLRYTKVQIPTSILLVLPP